VTFDVDTWRPTIEPLTTVIAHTDYNCSLL